MFDSSAVGPGMTDRALRLNYYIKMKDYKIFYTLFMLLSMSLGFTACSDDDDDSISGDGLIGTWEAIWEQGYEKREGYEDDIWDEAPEDPFRVTFNQDDTYQSEYYDNGKWYNEQNGSYSVKGNKLYVIDDEGDRYEITIVSLTSTQLILEEYEKYTDEDGVGEDYRKVTYKRIK